MRKWLFISLLLFFSSPASADLSDYVKAYDTCLVERIGKFKNSCEPADQVAAAVVEGCSEQLRTLAFLITSMTNEDKAATAKTILESRKETVQSLLIEYRLDHPCK